jgi:hypothetical protein
MIVWKVELQKNHEKLGKKKLQSSGGISKGRLFGAAVEFSLFVKLN